VSNAARISPRNALFILVSFEGPDPYSQAGGLGVRVTGLSQTLANAGYETHMFFIGDAHLPGEEVRMDGRLVLHRWCQWISAYHPGGVYDGEENKLEDLTRSLPPYLLEKIVLPAVANGRTPIVLLEEWQTAEVACRIAEGVRDAGVRDRTVIFWNANNPYGFHRIDWQRLGGAVTITAVSRYMRSIIRAAGADALVIPNGISPELLGPVQRADVGAIRAALGHEARAGMFFKMARWEREKGWTQALDAMQFVRDLGKRMVLVGRSGGPSGAGGGLTHEARNRGLNTEQVNSEPEFRSRFSTLVRRGTEVVSLGFGVTPALARSLYAASDGVLANSVSEPFGLVGLEAMAAGGIAYTGGTGEDYAVTGRNAIVLETMDPREIVEHWQDLAQSPSRETRLRRAARRTAREYSWERVACQLFGTAERQADRQLGVAPAEAEPGTSEGPSEEATPDGAEPEYPANGVPGAPGYQSRPSLV